MVNTTNWLVPKTLFIFCYVIINNFKKTQCYKPGHTVTFSKRLHCSLGLPSLARSKYFLLLNQRFIMYPMNGTRLSGGASGSRSSDLTAEKITHTSDFWTSSYCFPQDFGMQQRRSGHASMVFGSSPLGHAESLGSWNVFFIRWYPSKRWQHSYYAHAIGAWSNVLPWRPLSMQKLVTLVYESAP